MNDPSTGRRPAPDRYQIRIAGHLGPRWAACFDGMTLTSLGDGTTALEGTVVDQAALHGLLAKLRDLGLPLISLTQADADRPSPSDISSETPAAFWHTTSQGE